MGYGSAAVKFDNGSIIDVAKINGNAEYLSLMKRKAEEVSKPPWEDTIWEKVKRIVRRLTRYFNNLRSLPSTDEARVIANMLEPLIKATGSILGSQKHITGVAVSLPYFPFYPAVSMINNVKDAGEYLGIKVLRSLDEFEVAYAAEGLGLCESYRDFKDCETEEYWMPARDVLGISFNAASVAVSCSRNTVARSGYRSFSIQEPSLGYNGNQTRPTRSEEDYWDQLHDLIVKAVMTELVEYEWSPDVLLLFGDAVEAATDNLVEVIERSLRTLFPEYFGELNIETRIPQYRKNGNDYIFPLSRGAAEFARRFQGSPDACFEDPSCRAERPDGVKDTGERIIAQIGR
ncbi:hypothetical protein TWF694_011418 [Orbilia ellipsospora]|uniref:Uncharacterized protein n=1 Tax=Orbilia ellipsospora TaxID=2528407 RepID=A0AAV9X6E6_9PEZI